MVFVVWVRSGSRVKTYGFEAGAFIALLGGVLSAWWLPQTPETAFFELLLCLSVVFVFWCLRHRRLCAVLLIPTCGLLGFLAVGVCAARMAVLRAKPEDAGRVLLVTGTVREVRITRYGASLVLNQPKILRPAVAFRFKRLLVYTPKVPPDWDGLQIRAWVRLKQKRVPRTIPHPMQALQQRHLPHFVASVTSPKLVRYTGQLRSQPRSQLRGQPRGPTRLNAANRQLIGLFTANGPVPIWRERLDWMGLGHLLSISGLHCGLVWLLLRLLLTPVRAPGLRVFAACLGMVAFAAQMGWSDSVTRATCFFVVFQGLWACGRVRCWLRVWAVLTAVSLVVDPTCLLRQGFWYSYAVSLGLVLGLGPTPERSPLIHPWSPRLRWLRGLIAAQVFALPVGLLFGVRLNWAAFGWNLFGVLVLIGLLLLCAAAMVGRLSDHFARAANWLDDRCDVFFTWLRQSEGWWCEVRFPWEPAFVMAALLLLFLALHYGGRERRWLLCLLLILAGRVCRTPLEGSRLVVLDVGQGSCALLVADNGDGWLLDAGGRLPPFVTFGHVLRLYGVRRLSGGLISHYNRDHYAFLETTAVTAPLWVPRRQLSEFQNHAHLKRLRWVGVAGPMRHNLGDFEIQLLWPRPDQPTANANEGSLVALVTFPAGVALFPGDAGTQSEPHWQFPLYQDGRRWLILGHHGSRSATGRHLLARYRPNEAVASCGRGNSFGHPHASVLARLARFKVNTRITAENGTLMLWEALEK